MPDSSSDAVPYMVATIAMGGVLSVLMVPASAGGT